MIETQVYESEKDTENESEIWYAMRATYRREPDAMRLLEKEKMGCFVPMQYKISLKKGKKVRALVPIVHNLLFVHARPSDVKRVNLSKGTKVRVTGGDFEGQEGIFLKVKGARDRRVVVEIQGVIAVAMTTIHPDLIEVIK